MSGGALGGVGPARACGRPRGGAPRLAGCLVLAAALLAPCVAGAQVLARFANGERISAQDYTAYVAKRIDLRGAARTYSGAEAAVKEMALTRALVLEGARLGVKSQKTDTPERFDDIYAQSVFTQVAPKCERPPDAAAARRYFDSHPAAFRIPPSARLARVMLPVAQEVDGRDAMAWLRDQAAGISAGKIKLQDVIARADQLYREQAQGDVGWTQLEGDNIVIRAIASAKQGELLGPVREGEFAYLFFVEVKRDGRQMRWAEAETSVASRAVSYCRENAAAQVRESLFKQYGIEVDGAAVRSLFAPAPGAAKAAPGASGAVQR